MRLLIILVLVVLAAFILWPVGLAAGKRLVRGLWGDDDDRGRPPGPRPRPPPRL